MEVLPELEPPFKTTTGTTHLTVPGRASDTHKASTAGMAAQRGRWLMGPQSIGASLAACVQPGGGRVGSASVQRDLPGALACDGAAVRPRVVECGTAHAGAQLGQGVIAVRGARYPCVQPATAVGF